MEVNLSKGGKFSVGDFGKKLIGVDNIRGDCRQQI